MVCMSGIYIYILKNRAQKSQNILENNVYTFEILNASTVVINMTVKKWADLWK